MVGKFYSLAKITKSINIGLPEPNNLGINHSIMNGPD